MIIKDWFRSVKKVMRNAIILAFVDLMTLLDKKKSRKLAAKNNQVKQEVNLPWLF